MLYKVVAPLLLKTSLKGLIVSLDGATPETHDKMRGKGTFTKITSNIMRISQSPRARSGDLTVEISFVMSQINLSDASRIVSLTKSLGASRLNVKNVKLTGRALQFSDQLSMDYRDLLEAYCSLLITWMSGSAIQLDVYVPPAFALYLNRRFGFNFPIDAHPACGGINEYGYVDLLGNYLPCPAMSFEEDPIDGLKFATPELNLLTTDAQKVRKSSQFVNFEKRRVERSYHQQMFPCNHCRYNKLCSPCTADLIRGNSESEVDICMAVFKHGDEDVPGLQCYIFGSAE